MKIRSFILAIFFIALFQQMAFAQMGVNSTGAAPSPSAMLDVSSTTRGLLAPRMTTAQRTGILSPAIGLLVYDTTTQSFWYYNGSVWVNDKNTWNTFSANISSANTGNVGIGTNTPAAKLDVNSSIANVAQFNGPSSMYMGIYENTQYRGYWGSFAGAAEDVDFGTGGGNTTGKLHLTIKANPALTIDPIGNVGIGTTTPKAKLNIIGTGNTAATTTFLLQNSTGDSIIRVNDNGRTGIGNNISLNIGSRTLNVGGYGFSSGIGFYDESLPIGKYGGAIFSYIPPNRIDASLVIDSNNGGHILLQPFSNQRVGIGTAYPFGKLHLIEELSFANYSLPAPFSWSSRNAAIFLANYVTGPPIGTFNSTITAVLGACTSTALYNIGVTGLGQGGENAYGVYGSASGGIYSNYGVFCSGNGGYTGTWSSLSDGKFKNNIVKLEEGAVGKLMKLKPSSYTLKTEEYKFMHLPEGSQFGFVAQDIEQVFPTLVVNASHPGEEGVGGSTNRISYKAVNYIGLIPILTKAIQEQQTTIDDLKSEIELMRKEFAALKKSLGK